MIKLRDILVEALSESRDILIRIFKEGRKNKITPDKMVDFVMQKAKQSVEEN